MIFTQFPAARTIFFDAGFTLLHASLTLTCQQVCQNYGIVVDEKRIHDAAQHLINTYQRAIQEEQTWKQENTIQDMWINYYQQLLPLFLDQCSLDTTLLAQAIYHKRELPTSWHIYPDVIPVLKQLKARGYTIGIISNWGVSLRSILSHHGILPWVDCLIVSSVVHCAKPSPAIFEIALKRTQTQTKEALYIGDNYQHDVIGARTAGMTPILLDRSMHTYDAMYCQVIHSLFDLLC